MGLENRDYYTSGGPSQGMTFGGNQRTVVTNLVIINAVIFLADAFTRDAWLSNFLSLKADMLTRPWEFWQLLTSGFAHSPLGSNPGIWHVVINMFMLWMFGRTIEERLGRKEFLAFYLAAIIVSGIVWLLMEYSVFLTSGWLRTADGREIIPQAVGASGGVTAVFMLFILFYPRQTLYLWGLLAVPAWLIGSVVIGIDLMRGLSGSSDVAWQAHLGGAGFAYLYLRSGRKITSFLPGGKSSIFSLPKRRPKLKIHDPERAAERTEAEADRVLAKLHREGEQSLSSRERRILEKYSRQVRDKRQ